MQSVINILRPQTLGYATTSLYVQQGKNAKSDMNLKNFTAFTVFSVQSTGTGVNTYYGTLIYI